MTKQESIDQALASLQSAQTAALGSCYDAGVASVGTTLPSGSTPGTFTQADIDAAVAQVTAKDQKAMQDLQSKLDLEDKDIAAIKANAAAILQQALAVLGVSAPAAPANP